MNPLNMENDLEKSYAFTIRAWSRIEGMLDREMFLKMEPDALFRALVGQFRPRPFHEYLKRYLYLKAGIRQPFHTVQTQAYLDIVMAAFQETNTPASFLSGTTRLRQSATNWLTRNDVSRDAVLLMGFGLYMTPEEVNDFLAKALHASVLDPDQPREAVCLYCYQHQYSFAKYQQLWHLYETMGDQLDASRIEQNQPVNRPASRIVIAEDTDLLSHLLACRKNGGLTPAQIRAREAYVQLYQGTLQMLSRETSSRPGRGPGMVEKVLSAYAPVSPHGNLVSRRAIGTLADFARRRVSRQQIHNILTGSSLPSRYDILTLHFYQQSELCGTETDRKKALIRFMDSSDSLLTGCGFGGLYPADPYDAFLSVCMLTDDPFAAYSDIMEYAYTDLNNQETEQNP